LQGATDRREATVDIMPLAPSTFAQLYAVSKLWDIRAYTFNGDFICVECGCRTSANSDGDRPQPVFSEQWNTEEHLEAYGSEVFCAKCDEKI
jgi:hypothetical protein